MTDTVTVYRIEATRGTDTGHGPYAACPDYFEDQDAFSARNAAMCRIDSWDDQHPTPQEDPGIGRRIEKHEFCAFESIDAARSWFGNGALELLCGDHGFFVLVAYDVPRDGVTFGAYQCLFAKDDATRRDLVDLPA